jgi:hypothetical protein
LCVTRHASKHQFAKHWRFATRTAALEAIRGSIEDRRVPSSSSTTLRERMRLSSTGDAGCAVGRRDRQSDAQALRPAQGMSERRSGNI